MSSHKLFGRQLSRDSEHRKAMRRNLVQSLFEHGKVKTTPAKAKESKALAEKLITLAKTGTLTARRRVIAILQDRRLVDENQDFLTGAVKTVVQRLFTEVAPKFKGRDGGYTRIIKLAQHRIGDAGDQVMLMLADESEKPKGTIRKSAGLRRKRYEKRNEFAKKARAPKAEPAAATA